MFVFIFYSIQKVLAYISSDGNENTVVMDFTFSLRCMHETDFYYGEGYDPFALYLSKYVLRNFRMSQAYPIPIPRWYIAVLYGIIDITVQPLLFQDVLSI